MSSSSWWVRFDGAEKAGRREGQRGVVVAAEDRPPAEHVAVEVHRPAEVAHVEHEVPQLLDLHGASTCSSSLGTLTPAPYADDVSESPVPPVAARPFGEQRLDAATLTDIDAVADAFTDPDIALWNPGARRPGATSRERATLWVADRMAWAPDHCSWVVRDADGALVGQVSIHSLDEEIGSGEIGYWLTPAGRGRGIGAAAVDTATRFAFDTARAGPGRAVPRRRERGVVPAGHALRLPARGHRTPELRLRRRPAPRRAPARAARHRRRRRGRLSLR